MLNAKELFEKYLADTALIPISYRYGRSRLVGFENGFFTEVGRAETYSESKRTAKITLVHDELKVEIELALYEKYNAIDYVVYFSANGEKNTKVLKDVYALDCVLPSCYSTLSGILGDHKYCYKEYIHNLKEKTVKFNSDLGRASHIYFPYFQLVGENCGILLALGWGGTWKAEFAAKSVGTRIKMQGTSGFKAYIKPGERIRTPLMAAVFYNGDMADATNAWRHWMIDCNLPRQNGKPVPPFSTVCLATDTGRPNSDGSISEYSGSYKRSMDAYFGGGLTADFRWFDAGWYCDADGNTVPSDWHGTVGTWELDKEKWPGDSFLDSVKYAREHSTKTLVWFEPERITHTESLIKNYGYKKEWVLHSQSKSLLFWINKNIRDLNNLGNEDALEWTFNRIKTFLERYEIDMYREDFNTDPASFWATTDRKLGPHRKGITENLYMQGHYKLWDKILELGRQNGKCTFLDSCASGGGRNDLESARRSVPLLRSDSDRTTISLRLAMTTSVVKWLPFSGCTAKESSSELADGIMDLYVLRASYLPAYNLSASWYHDKTLDYPTIKKSLDEWKEIKEYFYKDFYVLTPYRSPEDSTGWTVYEYFDLGSGMGVLQAFRQTNCPDGEITVCVRGIDPKKRYLVRDVDGETREASGEELLAFTIKAAMPRTALIIYIQKID